MCPHIVAVLKLKIPDPQGISRSNIMVLIADHSQIILHGDPQGPLSKTGIEIYYVKWWHSFFVWACDHNITPPLGSMYMHERITKNKVSLTILLYGRIIMSCAIDIEVRSNNLICDTKHAINSYS